MNGDNMNEIIITAIPWVISAASVFVAGLSIRANKKLAYKQAVFDRMAKNYEDFLIAFSAVAYDRYNPEKRAALTHALYRATLFSSMRTRESLQFFVHKALGAKEDMDIKALESACMTEVLSHINEDMRGFWKKGKIPSFPIPKEQKDSQEGA